MRKKRIKVFFRRVSTTSQSLEMQLAADKRYRDELDEDDYIEVNELGVSANKVKLMDRRKFVDVLDLIKKDEVETLYVYDRSRLTRNFYEYVQLVDLFIENNIDVIFTTESGHMPFSSNYLVEGFNGILVEEEGKGIARRTTDSHRKLPPKKFGFDVVKDAESGKKQYFVTKETQLGINHLFECANRISDTKDFMELLLEQSKLLKRKPFELIRTLTDSFYAGHEKIGKRYSKLSYVQPVISLKFFKQTQNSIEPYIKTFQENIEYRENESALTPICGKCKKKMIYRKSKLGETGQYTCSNKHQKISIEVQPYNQLILENARTYCRNLNRQEIKGQALELLNNLIDKFNRKVVSTTKEIENQELSLALMPLSNYESGEFMSGVNDLKTLKSRKKEMKENVLHCDNYKYELQNLLNCVLKGVDSVDLSVLLGIFVKDVFVHETTVAIDFYFNKYIDNQNLERMISNEGTT